MQFTAGVPVRNRILSDAFDANIGRSVPFRVGDRIVGSAVVKAVQVLDGSDGLGQAVYVTLDIPEGLVMSAIDAMTAQSSLFAPYTPFSLGDPYAKE